MATKKKTQRGSSRYLPGDLISEILRRLPPKTLLRCRAVCKAWRDLASDRELLLNHHRRQLAHPLITLFHEVCPNGDGSLPYNCLEAVDLSTDEHRRLARFTDRVNRGWNLNLDFDVYALAVHGSCDGLILLSFHDAFFVCNPTTRQGTLLPPLDDEKDEITGFYKHADSGEYRVLYHRGDRREREYYVLTVGSQQARSIWRMPPPLSVVQGLERGMHGACVWPPALLRGSLHWPPPQCHKGNILVFDIAAESFRWISPPAAAATCDFSRLFEMDGKLAMFYWEQLEWILDLWLMEDYEKMIWVYKYQIELSPMHVSRQIHWDPPIVYRGGDMRLKAAGDMCCIMIRRGNCRSFDCDVAGINITPHVFKESLVLHEFLQTQQNGVVTEPPFFEGS